MNTHVHTKVVVELHDSRGGSKRLRSDSFAMSDLQQVSFEAAAVNPTRTRRERRGR